MASRDLDIVKQIDSSDTTGVSDDLVGFIEPIPTVAGSHLIDRYTGSVYRRPLGAEDRALVYCGHEHRELDAAVACLVRLLRQQTQELQ